MGLIFILIFTYGFIDWTAWFGLSLSATDEFIVVLLIPFAAILLKLATNGMKLKSVSRSYYALFFISFVILVIESAHAYIFKASWIVVSYCILILALIFVLAQNVKCQHYYKNTTALFWMLTLIQILVLLLALMDFDAATSLGTTSSAGIERKMEMYGAESFYAYRNIGPYYFSSVTDKPIFDDFGILGFSREPHISFTLMAVLLGLALQNLASYRAKLAALVAFSPTFLYISTSNLAALLIGVILYFSIKIYLGSRYLKIMALLIFPVAIVLGLSFVDTAVQYATESLIDDRSIFESVLNILRLFDPAMAGSGLTDIYDRNNLAPVPIGIVPLALYLSFTAIVCREIVLIMRSGLRTNALILCYLLIYSLKCATVFIFLPMIVAIIIVSKTHAGSARLPFKPIQRISK